MLRFTLLALAATFLACGLDRSVSPPGDVNGGSSSSGSSGGSSSSSSGSFTGSSGGSSSGVGSSSGGSSSGASSSGGSSSGGYPDGGSSGSSSGSTPNPANIVVAHAAPGVPPFRICFGTSSAGGTMSVTPIPAIPDAPADSPRYPATGPYSAVPAGTPGIYPGTISAFPQITDLSAITLVPFAVLASSTANDVNFDGGDGIDTDDGGVEEDCVHLIGTHGLGVADTGAGATRGRLTLDVDYFPLAAIPAGSLLDDRTYLLTLNGCLPNGTPGASAGLPETQTCGSGYDGGVSASMGVAQLDTTTFLDGGTIGVQFAHRSTAVENTAIFACANPPTCSQFVEVHAPAADGVRPALFPYGAPPLEVTPGPIPYSAVGLTPTPPIALSVDPAGTAQHPTMFGVSVQPLDGGAPNALPWPGAPPGAGGPGDLLAMSLDEIAQLSSWNASTAAAPSGFQLGHTYTFLLVGDPAAEQLGNPDGGAGTNPAWDGRGVHFVAFPNVFTPKVF